MAKWPFSRASTGVLCVALALVSACEKKDSAPTGPPTDSNTALYGTWVGSLTGPIRTQPSGWSPEIRDSIWIVFGSTSSLPADSTKYFMAPAGPGPALSDRDLNRDFPEDTCFVRYATANNSLADPNVSFRVNFAVRLRLDSAVPFAATRTGNTLTGTMTIPGDTLAGNWTATLCTTCPTSSVTTSIDPDTVAAGGAQFALTVDGSNFTTCSIVLIDGAERPTTFVSTNQVIGTISGNDRLTEGTRTITVFTPVPGGVASNSRTLTIVPSGGLAASRGGTR